MTISQCDRVLKAARAFNGTCQADWLADTTPDGGPRITRLAARLQDLEDRGCTFEILGRRNGTRVYRLVSEPDTTVQAPAPRPPASDPSETPTGLGGGLFDLPVHVGPPAVDIYDPYAA